MRCPPGEIGSGEGKCLLSDHIFGTGCPVTFALVGGPRCPPQETDRSIHYSLGVFPVYSGFSGLMGKCSMVSHLLARMLPLVPSRKRIFPPGEKQWESIKYQKIEKDVP